MPHQIISIIEKCLVFVYQCSPWFLFISNLHADPHTHKWKDRVACSIVAWSRVSGTVSPWGLVALSQDKWNATTSRPIIWRQQRSPQRFRTRPTTVLAVIIRCRAFVRGAWITKCYRHKCFVGLKEWCTPNYMNHVSAWTMFAIIIALDPCVRKRMNL